MARMLPQLDQAQLHQRPHSERLVYCAMRDLLPARQLVLFSHAWVDPTAVAPRDGEADFLVADPLNGILVVEVKGGGVRIDPRRGWTSVNRQGEHSIKDPFRQAVYEKHAILGQLRSHPLWHDLGSPRVICGHAVLFPDLLDVRPLAAPDRDLRFMGGRGAVESIAEWVESVFTFWKGTDTRLASLGDRGLQALERILTPHVSLLPSTAVRLRDEEETRIRLTSQQARIMRSLGSRARAVISGGAGTGKTVLAFDKARELAGQGLNTLLLCYNRPLADALNKRAAGISNLAAMSFHQLCDWKIRAVRARAGQDLLREAKLEIPSGDLFEDILPHALALSAEHLEERYDAVLVDEAQDFRESYWLPVQLLLRDLDKSILYLFHDANQAVYGRRTDLPVNEQPLLLTANCRNTRQIHEAAYRYFAGEPTDPCEIDGIDVASLCSSTLEKQAEAIAAQVTWLLDRERVDPRDIAVLIGGDSIDAYRRLLARHRLPSGVRWADGLPCPRDSVLVETVRRFKGLESPIVFLWGFLGSDSVQRREAVYVGTSRAKSELILVGTRADCEALHDGASGERCASVPR